MAEVAKAYVSLIPSAKGFGKGISKEIGGDLDKAGKDGGTRFGAGMNSQAHTVGKKFGGVLAVGLKAGVAAIAVGVGAALAAGFGRLTAIEDASAKLTGLGHSAKEVKSIMNDALKSVKGTAFGLDEAAKVAATSVAAGVKPGKELQKTLGLVADAATIGGTSMSEMGSVFNKVASANKIQGDVIAQLNDMGIPIVQLLGKTMGKTSGEVTKLASKGKIDFATFQTAMSSGLGGAALDSGKTTEGSLKNMGAAFSRFGANLLTGVFPQVKVVFGGITKFLDDIGGALSKGGLGAMFAQIGTSISAAWPGIQAQLLKMASAFWAWIEPLIPPMLAKLGQLLVSLGTWIVTKALPAIGAQLSKWGTAFWAWIQPMIPPFLVKMGDLLTQLGTWFTGTALPAIAAKLVEWGKAFVEWIQPMIPPMLTKLGDLLVQLGNWLLATGLPWLGTHLLEWGKAFAAWIGPMIPPVLLALGGLLLKLGGWMLTVALPALGSMLLSWGKAYIAWVQPATINMLKALIPMLGRLGTWIVSTAAPQLVTKLMEWSKAFASWIARAIIEAPGKLLGLLGTIITWAKSVGPKILSTLGDLSGLLRNAGMDIVRGLISGIGSMASAVGHALLGLLPGPLQKFANKLGIKSPSKVFADFGANIGQGLVVGMDGSRGAVEASMTGLVSLPRVGSLDFASSSARSAAVAGGAIDYDRLASAMSRVQIGLDGKNVAVSVDRRLAPR